MNTSRLTGIQCVYCVPLWPILAVGLATVLLYRTYIPIIRNFNASRSCIRNSDTVVNHLV